MKERCAPTSVVGQPGVEYERLLALCLIGTILAGGEENPLHFGSAMVMMNRTRNRKHVAQGIAGAIQEERRIDNRQMRVRVPSCLSRCYNRVRVS